MRALVLAAVVLGVTGGCASLRGPAPGGGDGAISMGGLFAELAPFGDWLPASGTGQVWRPARGQVDPDFRPYVTGGRWAHTNYGWTFESEWEWGWVVFHYGRWLLDSRLGWVWTPDTVWGPAWVSWRFGGGVVGWAPLPPFRAGLPLQAHLPSWTLVETRHFAKADPGRFALPPERVGAAMALAPPLPTSPIMHYAIGPPPDEVSAADGAPVQSYLITPPPIGLISRHRFIGPRPPRVEPSLPELPLAPHSPALLTLEPARRPRAPRPEVAAPPVPSGPVVAPRRATPPAPPSSEPLPVVVPPLR